MTGAAVLALSIGGVRFARPWLLLLLLAVPLALALRLWLAAWRRGATRRLIGAPQIAAANGRARFLKGALLLCALSLLALAAARPQIGEQPVLLPREGADVMVALDVSASMLATDVTPNRLEHAKLLIGQLLDGLQGDRVGLTVFAGSAVLRFPLTTDIDSARSLTNGVAIREGNLKPGTGIGDALRVSAAAFGPDAARSKLIVLISDGEDLAGAAPSAVELPKSKGVTLFTIGLGTEEGAPLIVPDPRGGRPQPRLDPSTGQPAVSRANEALLRQLAEAGGGRFFNGNGDDAIGALNSEIAGLERTKFASQEGSLPVERFQWFVGAALAMLMLEMLIPERRRGRQAQPATAQRRRAA